MTMRIRRGGGGGLGAVAAALVLAAAPAALAQLRPDRTYYGINRPMPMSVTVPADLAAAADGDGGERVGVGAAIVLLEPVTAAIVESAPVKVTGPAGSAGSAGGEVGGAAGVDMAALFPSLWTTPVPRVLYAQLVVEGKKVGPAVVLQPMITPAYPVAMNGPTPRFPPDATRQKTYTGIRAYVDQNVVLETSKGTIRVALRPDAAPNTVWNFRGLVEGGFYTDIIVHRVVALDPMGRPFVVQTGDPTGKGEGGPGYYIDLEPSTLPHDFGVLSMARSGDPNTNGSQFFICLGRDGTAMLDGVYTSFAQAVDGAEAIQAIAATPITPPGAHGRDRPVDPPVIKSARLVDAPPYGDGPGPVRALGTGPIEK